VARRFDLLEEVAGVASDVAGVYALPGVDYFLDQVCQVALRVGGAEATSVAAVDEVELEFVYRAAAGRGADRVRGMRLPLDAGLAGFVASSGQAISVEDVHKDPRFASDVAEELGYIPRRMIVVPINTTSGEIIGVLAILDRTVDSVGEISLLDIAADLADLAALGLVLGGHADALGASLLQALADAAETAADDAPAERRVALANALRRQADELEDESSTAGVAARLAELRALGPGITATAERLLDELIDYARASRGRRR